MLRTFKMNKIYCTTNKITLGTIFLGTVERHTCEQDWVITYSNRPTHFPLGFTLSYSSPGLQEWQNIREEFRSSTQVVVIQAIKGGDSAGEPHGDMAIDDVCLSDCVTGCTTGQNTPAPTTAAPGPGTTAGPTASPVTVTAFPG